MIYSINNFLKITHHNEQDEDEIQQLLGDLSIAIPYYQSELIFLVGSENNKNISDLKLVLWDDRRSKKLASVDFNNKIYDAKIAQNSFFVLFKNKVLVFDLIDFSYVCTLEDFYMDTPTDHKYALAPCYLNWKKHNKVIFSYVSHSNSQLIKINKFRFDEKNKICSKLQVVLLVKDVKAIQFLESDERGDYLAVVSSSGSKIRVYNTQKYHCKYHFWRGNADAKIIKICFDVDNKYMALISNQSTFHFFKFDRTRQSQIIQSINLKEESKDSIGHQTDSDEEEESILSEIFSDMMSLFSNKKYKRSFAKFRSNLVKEMGDIICYFTKNKEFAWLDTNGELIELKFNRSKGGDCWISNSKECTISNKFVQKSAGEYEDYSSD